MPLKLLYSVPAKRFDPCRSLCGDGRGGWVFSQVNVDREVTQLEDYYLLFGLGVLVENALEKDHVIATRLTARINDEVIGVSQLEWKRPNRMWGKNGTDAIFEWVQTIEMQPTEDGLIVIEIEARLESEPEWKSVEGNAYCRITEVDSENQPELKRRFVSRFWFTLSNVFQKPFYPRTKNS